MSIPGEYTFYWSWGCNGQYAMLDMTFNADGTFAVHGIVGGSTGKWWQQDSTLLWKYNSGAALYGGTVNGGAGSGIMSTFNGINGCWYLIKKLPQSLPTPKFALKVKNYEALKAHTYDPAGNKVE